MDIDWMLRVAHTRLLHEGIIPVQASRNWKQKVGYTGLERGRFASSIS